jgi:transposase-like protein
MERAKADGVSLVGPDGMLAGLTKRVLESMLEAEMTEHVGYEAHDPAGHNSGSSTTTPSYTGTGCHHRPPRRCTP